MAVPARNDSTDHLLITAHLYWLTAGDGEGSKGIQYTERQPRVHTKTMKCQCVLNTSETDTLLTKHMHKRSRSSAHTCAHGHTK